MKPDPTATTRRAYDAMAGAYWERWHHVDPLVEAKEAFAGRLPGGAWVLDVGCGTGRDAEWFADRGYGVVGLDGSFGMLRVATPSLPLVNADMRRLPLREAGVDGWWAAASLLHLDPAGARTALRELHRVTRPGGSGFVSVKEGEGQGFQPTDESGHQRFFCLWESGDLDDLLIATGWAVTERWTAEDTLGREPWLCRIVTHCGSRTAARIDS